MRRVPLSLLLPALAGLVACGGAVSTVDGASSGSTAGSSGSTSGGSSGSSGSSGMSSSGSSGTSSGTLPLPDSGVDLCEGNTYRPLRGVLKGTIVDAMELREVFPYAGEGSPPVIVDTEGVPCGSAADKATCKSQFAAAALLGWPMDRTGGEIASSRYLVTTRGDVVETIGAGGGENALWGPSGISTVEQAGFAATKTGTYRIMCDGKPNASVASDGFYIRAQSGTDCGTGTKIEEHVLRVARSGNVSVEQTRLVKEGNPNCAIGRKPAGLAPRVATDVCDDALGRFFADAAYLEAASVFSFERLARELATLGAPPSLVREALASREDEIRHARTTTALAGRFGATVTKPSVAAPPARSVFAIALENAVEGCVRETYGALVAHWQASHASEARIQSAMRVIAEDETRHAQLSLDVAAFLDALLTGDERRAIEAARREAIEALRAELAVEPDATVVEVAGLPCARDALRLLDALTASHLRSAA